MSTTPPDQQQQPSSLEVAQQAYTNRAGHGSVGSVIAVVAVITILGFLAGMIGRLCSGRRVFGHGKYDFEGWVETKCSSCLDGHVGPPPTRLADIAVAHPMELVPEDKKGEEHEQEQLQDKPHASFDES